MEPFDELMRDLGVAVTLAAFGTVLYLSLAAGVEPPWALARAIAAFAVIAVVHSALCRAVTGWPEDPPGQGIPGGAEDVGAPADRGARNN
jgi:hypothetical protein